MIFNEALKLIERNEGTEVLNGKIHGGLLFPGHRVKALGFLTNEWQARWSPAQDLSILPDADDVFQY
jgi:hypothetical protein